MTDNKNSTKCRKRLKIHQEQQLEEQPNAMERQNLKDILNFCINRNNLPEDGDTTIGLVESIF